MPATGVWCAQDSGDGRQRLELVHVPSRRCPSSSSSGSRGDECLNLRMCEYIRITQHLHFHVRVGRWSLGIGPLEPLVSCRAPRSETAEDSTLLHDVCVMGLSTQGIEAEAEGPGRRERRRP